MKDGILVMLRGPLSTAAIELAGSAGVAALEDWSEVTFCEEDEI